MAAAGGAQRKTFFNATPAGQMTKTFVAGDVTTLTNAMAADIAAQMNVCRPTSRRFRTSRRAQADGNEYAWHDCADFSYVFGQ